MCDKIIIWEGGGVMFANIFTEIKKIFASHSVEARDVWQATQNCDGDNVIFSEIESDRVSSNFIRIIPASLVLFLVEVGGIGWTLCFDNDFQYGLEFFISLCVFCVVSFMFIIFINIELKNQHLSLLNKKMFYSFYWLVYTVEALSFSLLEIFESGSINNFAIYIVVFTALPIIKPIEKAILYLASTLIEIGALMYVESIQKRINIVIVLCVLGSLASFLRYYFYIADSLTNKRLEYSANGDALTGFMNRRGMEKRVEGLKGFCVGNDYHFCTVMIDIDDFKRFNDLYGHIKGDTCLQTISAKIKESYKRPTDLCIRYGGEEFLILTAQKSIDKFLIHTKEMHEIISKTPIEGIDEKVTVSVGVYIGEIDNSTTLQELIDRADKNLYLAKNNGKNCIYYNEELYK